CAGGKSAARLRARARRGLSAGGVWSAGAWKTEGEATGACQKEVGRERRDPGTGDRDPEPLIPPVAAGTQKQVRGEFAISACAALMRCSPEFRVFSATLPALASSDSPCAS